MPPKNEIKNVSGCVKAVNRDKNNIQLIKTVHIYILSVSKTLFLIMSGTYLSWIQTYACTV